MTLPTPEEWFGGGAPSVTLEPGQMVEGDIVTQSTFHQRKYAQNGIGDLDYWEDGRPKIGLAITLATTLRDPELRDDDGQRRFYIDNKRKRDALNAALKAAQVRSTKTGGRLAIRCPGYDPDSQLKGNPAKLYEMRYTPPTEAAEFWGDQGGTVNTATGEVFGPPPGPTTSQSVTAMPVATGANDWAAANPAISAGRVGTQWAESPIPHIPADKWVTYSEDAQAAMLRMYRGDTATAGQS